jgi:hypothetical protein
MLVGLDRFNATNIKEAIMNDTLSKRFVRFALAAICLSAGISDSFAGSFTRGCAARDMQILMLIEQRETAEAFPTQKSRDAMFTLMHARMVCHQGRVMDALAIYDTIAQTIVSESVLPGRIN